MGQDPSDEDLFDMIAAVDEDGSGEIGKNRSSPAEDGARASIILVATCLNDHARACLPRTETKAFTTHAHIPSRLGLSPLNEHLSAFAPSLAPRTSQTSGEFCRVIANQKSASAARGDESDTIDAFISLGGAADKTGQVSADRLRSIVKDFGLTIDIERLIREVDTDHSGFIDYQEFSVMMTAS
jgi:hypothetical protein